MGEAWKSHRSFFRKHSIEFDDLVQEVQQNALDKLDYYDPEHPRVASLDTFITTGGKNYLKFRIMGLAKKKTETTLFDRIRQMPVVEVVA